MSNYFDINHMIKDIKKSLSELGFNDNETKVYIALTQLGEAPASQIAKKADLPRTTAISILNKLASDCFLAMHQYHGTAYYWIESPQALAGKFENQLRIAEDLSSQLADLYRSESHFPGARIFDTKSSIKNFIEKTLSLMPKKSVIHTIDTPSLGNYAKIFSSKSEDSYIKLKDKRNLSTKTLVPFGSIKEIDPRKLKFQNIELKELPPAIDFKSSLWLIDNLLVLFSGNPPFVVAVKHPLIVASYKSIFDYFWNHK